MRGLASTVLVLGLCLAVAHAELRVQNVDRKVRGPLRRAGAIAEPAGRL
jgi:hypothetical protein